MIVGNTYISNEEYEDMFGNMPSQILPSLNISALDGGTKEDSMVYKQKLVAVVKVDGKILREVGDCVYLPFGSEYSILLKNLESRNALVKISIDGRNVTDGGLIIKSNSSVDLERYIDNNMNRGNRFKFIQKTEKIVDHRGDRIDDGMIRVEYQFEKMKSEEIDINEHHHHIHHDHYPWRPYYPFSPIVYYGGQVVNSGSEIIGTGMISSEVGSLKGSISSSNCALLNSGECIVNDTQAKNLNLNKDEGITVKGSESNQSFNYAHISFLEENKHVIIIRLKGQVGKQAPVAKPLLVREKIQCPTCGTRNERANFCKQCGTHIAGEVS